MTAPEHRRRSSRFPLRWKAAVVFDSEPGKPVVHTQTQDLSVVGAAILSDHGDLTGAIVTLLLAYPASKAGEVPKVLKVRARVVSTVRTPGMHHYRHGLSFIRSPDDGVDALDEILRATALVAQREEPSGEDDAAIPAARGRLAQLRRLAQAQQTEGRTADPQEAINASISDALRVAHRYLKDLAEQLNLIHPAYPKGYAIAGLPEFHGLYWDEGHADFHTREISQVLRLYDRVSLRFRLSGDKEIRVVREFPANDRLKQWLDDCNIKYQSHDVRNARGVIEKTTFALACEVTASVLLQGQFEMGKLLLRTRNVSGFGAMEQILAPGAVSEESLDELTAYILGETSRVGPLLLRNA